MKPQKTRSETGGAESRNLPGPLLVGNGESLAAFGPAALKNQATVLGLHAAAVTVLVLSFLVGGTAKRLLAHGKTFLFNKIASI